MRQVSAQEKIRDKLRNHNAHSLKAGTLLEVDDVLNEFKQLAENHPDIKAIHAAFDADSLYIPVLEAALTPFVLDRLSIFAEQYPLEYSAHIFCSWLTALIARGLKMDGKTAKMIVRAALVRDFGLLYLPQNLMDSKVKYSSIDWNAMRSHTIIGQLMISDVGGLSEVEARAVLEHHERQNGQGYPKGLQGDEICLAAQIIGLVDTVAAIRVKAFKYSGRNLRDVFDYIQLKDEIFSSQVLGTFYKILTKGEIKKSAVNPFDKIEDLISHLYVRASAMTGSLRMMEKLMDVLVYFETGPKRNELLMVTGTVLKMIHETGALDDKMIKWLNNLITKKGAEEAGVEELSEIELLQNELYWQVKRVSDLLQSFHDSEMKVSSPHAQTIITILRCLNQKNLPKAAYE